MSATHLSHQDQMLAQTAQQSLIKAQAVWDFVLNHVAVNYQLVQGDTFDTATGLISRAALTGNNEEKAPEAPKKKAKRLPKDKPEVTD